MKKEDQIQEIKDAMMSEVGPEEGIYDLISEKIQRTIAVTIMITVGLFIIGFIAISVTHS